MEQSNPIRMGVDANLLIYLARFDDPRFDPKGTIHKLLDMNALRPEAYEEVPEYNLPPLLRNKFFNKVKVLPSGVQLYQRLINVNDQIKAIKEGKLQLYISPTVNYELRQDKLTQDFIDKYIIRLQVNNEDAPEFYGKRWELGNRYPMPKEDDARYLKQTTSVDAYIMAEYSLFGLSVITANEKHFLHEDVKLEDYNICNGIMECNKEYGLIFKNNIGKLEEPRPYSVERFGGLLKNALEKSRIDARADFINSNIDENNSFISF